MGRCRWIHAVWLGQLLLTARPALSEEPVFETVIYDSAPEEVRPQDDPAGFASVVRIKDPLPGVGLGELLARVPGLRVKDVGHGGRQGISIRGAEGHQVLVLLDGVRLSVAGPGSVDLSLFDPAHLEQVEVRRGGGGARFGSSALGGVLALRTPRLGFTARTRAALGYGSFNALWLRASHMSSRGRLRYLASGSFKRSDGDFPYVDSEGRQRVRGNNDSLAGEVLAKLDYLLSERWQASLVNSFSTADRGAPGTAGFPSQTGRQLDLHNLTSLGLSRLDLWTDGGTLDLNLYHRYTFFRFDQLAEHTIPEAHSRNQGFSIGAVARLGLPLASLGRLDVGAEVRSVLFKDAEIDDPQRLVTSLWASSKIELLVRHLVLVPAIRLCLSSDHSPTVVPRAGLVIRPFEWSDNRWLRALALAANVGRSFRLPSFQEMYIRLNGYSGNPDLMPEDAVEADAGVRWQSSVLSLEAAVFRRWIDNTILFAPITFHLVRADNYQGVSAQGAEASADLRPGLGLRVQASYTMTRTRFGEPAMALPGHPAHRLVARVGWHYPRRNPSPVAGSPAPARSWRLELWTGATIESAQVLSRFNSTEEEARVLLSAGGRLSWHWMSFSVEGNNLLDKRDALDTVGFPLAPARFFTSLALRI